MRERIVSEFARDTGFFQTEEPRSTYQRFDLIRVTVDQIVPEIRWLHC